MKKIAASLAVLGLMGAVAFVAFRTPLGVSVIQSTAKRFAGPAPCTIAPGRRFTIDFHGMTYYGDSSTLIDQRILCRGDWGLTELRFLSAAVDASERADPVFLDVGANSGVYSLYLSKSAEAVHSFEPYPPVLERFEKSVAASGVSNIVIHRVGLGEEDAELPFEEPPSDNTGTGSFVPGFKTYNSARGLTLHVAAGDAYFLEHQISQVDVFKIDTEGFEKPVLRGLRRVMAENRPIGSLELTYEPGLDQLFRDGQDILDSLPEKYSLFVVLDKDDDGFRLVPFALQLSGKHPFQETVAAIPEEAVSRFAPWIDP